jgi:hypothetical protein
VGVSDVLESNLTVSLAPGASTTVAHGLRTTAGAITPNYIWPNFGTTIGVASYNSTNITFTNYGPDTQTAIFEAKRDHSIQRDSSNVGGIIWLGGNGTPAPTVSAQYVAVNSLANNEPDKAEWQALGVASSPRVRSAGVDIDGSGENALWVNYDAMAPGQGSLAVFFVVPADLPTPAKVQLQVPMRLPAGVVSSDVVLQTRDAANVSLQLAHVTLTGVTQTFTLPELAVTPGAAYTAWIFFNSGLGANVQQQALIGRPRVAVTSALPSSGPFAGTFNRYQVRPQTSAQQIYRNLRIADPTTGFYYWYSTEQCVWRKETTATSIAVAYINNAVGFPGYDFSVWVNGELFSEPVTTNDAAFHVLNVTGLPEGSKLLEVRQGMRLDASSPVGNGTPAAGDIVGCFVDAVFIPARDAVTDAPLVDGPILVGVGDSILSGLLPAYTSEPSEDGGSQIVRRRWPGSMIIDATASNCFQPTIATAAARAAYIAKLVAAGCTSLWIEHGLNDYLVGTWVNVGAFQTAYAAFVDELTLAVPGILIYCQTPIFQQNEAAVNTKGELLSQYRTAITNVANARLFSAAAGRCVLIAGTAIMPYNATNFADSYHPSAIGHGIYGDYISGPNGLDLLR